MLMFLEEALVLRSGYFIGVKGEGECFLFGCVGLGGGGGNIGIERGAAHEGLDTLREDHRMLLPRLLM